jgi:hypothetical protein
MVIVSGTEAVGEVSLVVSHDTANESTYDWPAGTSASSADALVTGYALTVVPAGNAPGGMVTDAEAAPSETATVAVEPLCAVVDVGLPNAAEETPEGGGAATVTSCWTWTAAL